MSSLYTWAQRLPRRWVCNMATLGRLGFLKAPGTWGSAAGLIYYTFVFHALTLLPYCVLLATTLWLSISICECAEAHFAARDPGYIILDEFVAVPLCFFPLTDALQARPTWWSIVCGFGLFRFFDILKPLGIRRLQKLPGGLGVVLDDVAAAAATCLVLHIGFSQIG